MGGETEIQEIEKGTGRVLGVSGQVKSHTSGTGESTQSESCTTEKVNLKGKGNWRKNKTWWSVENPELKLLREIELDYMGIFKTQSRGGIHKGIMNLRW